MPYPLSYSQTNYDGWTLHSNVNGDSVFLAVQDRWGTLYSKPINILLNPSVEIFKRQLSASFLRKPYGFQVKKVDTGVLVIFGPYGLLGGGRKAGGIAAAVSVAAGFTVVSLAAGPLAPFVVAAGGSLIGAGIQVGIHTYRAEEQNFTISTCAKEAAIGGVCSLAAAGAASGATPFIAKIVSHATTRIFCHGGANMLAQILYQGFSNKDINPIEALIVGVAGTTGAVATAGLDHLLGEGAEGILRVIVKGSCRGVASASATKVTLNVLNGKAAHEELMESTALGGFMGAAISLTDVIQQSEANNPELEVSAEERELVKPEPYATRADLTTWVKSLLGQGYRPKIKGEKLKREMVNENDLQGIMDGLLNGKELELYKEEKSSDIFTEEDLACDQSGFDSEEDINFNFVWEEEVQATLEKVERAKSHLARLREAQKALSPGKKGRARKAKLSMLIADQQLRLQALHAIIDQNFTTTS